MATRPKFRYVRSKALVEAYRTIPCQLCGADDGTVCCAHSNQSIHGKGGRIKASDDRGASLCSICHFQIDQGFLWTQEEKVEKWDAAHAKTIPLLVANGSWPKHIEVPT